MPFRICADDPITTLLRERFPEANVVRTPRASIQPLLAIGYQRGASRRLGLLASLLATTHDLPEPSAPAEVAGFQHKRSPSLSHKVALSLMGGVLEKMPGESAELVRSAFTGGDSFSLEVEGVQERSVDLGALGDALTGAVLDMANLAATPYAGFKPGNKFLVIDRTISATSFTLHATTDIDHTGRIAVPEAVSALATANLEASYEDNRLQRISFRRDAPLVFAFTVVALDFGSEGMLKSLSTRSPTTQLNPAPAPPFRPWPREYAEDFAK